MMSSFTEKEIQEAVVRVISLFGIEPTLPYQEMSFVGLGHSLRSIPIPELVRALKSMEGVILDTERHRVMVPSGYFDKGG